MSHRFDPDYHQTYRSRLICRVTFSVGLLGRRLLGGNGTQAHVRREL